MKDYKAPWGTSLIITSWMATVVCLGTAIVLIWTNGAGVRWLALFPLSIPCGGALFTIRGYTITSNAILVHRLFWATRLPLTGLQSARLEPDAMCGSIRTCGNGGLFSFTGWFRNKTLGDYRAFVTDPHQAVVLRFSRLSQRTVVLSPSPPADFVAEVGSMSPAS
jgi:hypothetical protein